MPYENMTNERFAELMKDPTLKLSDAEIKAGWHFCWDWDELLVNRYDTEGEGSVCTCFAPVKQGNDCE